MLFDLHFVQTVFDSLSEVVPPAYAVDPLESLKETARKQVDAGEKMVGEKTEQLTAIFGAFLVPIALIIAAFILKIAYDIFTGAADRVDKGIRVASSKVKEATSKLKKAVLESAVKKEENHPKKPRKKKKRMLFGEILTKFVMPSVSGPDIEKALEIQSGENPKRKIGEILMGNGYITRTEIQHTVKIQEKQTA